MADGEFSPDGLVSVQFGAKMADKGSFYFSELAERDGAVVDAGDADKADSEAEPRGVVVLVNPLAEVSGHPDIEVSARVFEAENVAARADGIGKRGGPLETSKDGGKHGRIVAHLST